MVCHFIALTSPLRHHISLRPYAHVIQVCYFIYYISIPSPFISPQLYLPPYLLTYPPPSPSVAPSLFRCLFLSPSSLSSSTSHWLSFFTSIIDSTSCLCPAASCPDSFSSCCWSICLCLYMCEIFVCLLVCVCVRACVRACMRACVRVCEERQNTLWTAEGGAITLPVDKVPFQDMFVCMCVVHV